MIRTVLAITAIVTVTTVVLAQSDPVATRNGIMRASGANFYGALPRMIKGAEPYDQAKVDAAFQQATEAAKQLPSLFPESSKGVIAPNSKYHASPKVWENKADFDARLAKYAKDVATARPQATSLDGLKAAFPIVRQNCDGCHETYQIKN